MVKNYFINQDDPKIIIYESTDKLLCLIYKLIFCHFQPLINKGKIT